MNTRIRNGLIVLGATVLASLAIAGIVHAATFLPVQGGTGIGSVTAGDVGECLQVLDDSPFTWTTATCGSGGGTPNSKWATSTGSDITPNGGGGILVSASSTIGNNTQASGLTIFGGATTTGNLLVVGSTTLQNFTFVNATGTRATTTSLFSGSASSTNLFATLFNLGTGLIGRSTTTNATTTTLFTTTASTSALYLGVGTGCLQLASGLVTSTGAACGGAGSTPGGNDTYVQFNDGGSAFGGDAGFVYNKTLDLVTLANIILSNSTTTSATTTTQNIQNLTVTASSTLANFTALNSTSTNATTTAFFSTSASSTNLFATASYFGNTSITGLGTLTNLLVNASSTLQNFTGVNATTSNATTSTLFATKASTTLLYLSGANGCLQMSAGLVSSTGSACGSGGGTSDFTFSTTYATTAAATSSPVWFRNNIYASSSEIVFGTGTQFFSKGAVQGSVLIRMSDGGSANEQATGDKSVAIGAIAKGVADVAIGYLSVASSTTSIGGSNATAIGYSSDALSSYTIAIGDNALALATGAIAIGSVSQVSDAVGHGIAIGHGSNVTGQSSVAIGFGAGNSINNSFMIGGNGGSGTDWISRVIIGYGSNGSTPPTRYLEGASSSGTDIAGGNLGIVAGQSTGNQWGGDISFHSSPAAGSSFLANATNTLMTIRSMGYIGMGTTTPRWPLQISSSTRPQLALSDSIITGDHWTLRNRSNSLFFATASPATFATSTTAAAFFDPNGIFTLTSGLIVATSTFRQATSTTAFFTGTASSTNLFSTNFRLGNGLLGNATSTNHAFSTATTSLLWVSNLLRVATNTPPSSLGWGATVGTTTVIGPGQIVNLMASSTSASTMTINWHSSGIQTVNLVGTANLVINATSSNPYAGGKYSLRLCQDNTGSRAVNWVTANDLFRWANDATTTITTTAKRCTWIALIYDGAKYDVVASTTNLRRD